MEQMTDIFYCEKHSDRAKAVLRALDGMSVEEAQDMLSWCSRRLPGQITIDWKKEAERQAREQQEKEVAALAMVEQERQNAKSLGAGETVSIKRT